MKKCIFTKLSKVIVAMCMVFCMTVGYVGSVEAAGWTTLSVSSSKTMKCYTLANANEPTYTSSSLTTKKGTVYPTDEITIVKIGTYKDSSKTIDYALIHYPTSNGTKEAYIALNKLSKAGYGAFTEMRANAKIENVYRRASSTRYGTSYISKGDVVYRSVTSGDYTQVIYPVTSGWKMAFIKTADANKYLNKTSTSTATTTTTTSATSNSITYGTYKGVDYTNKGLSAERVSTLNKAKKMVTVRWTAPCDIPTWVASSGAVNSATDVSGTSANKFVKGKTYEGVPYSMANHSYDDVAWKQLLDNGITTNSMSTVYYSGKSAGTAKGMDCSYFVYTAIKSAVGSSKISYQTTSTMLNSSYYKKLEGISKVKGGDIFLKSGHTMMFVGKTSDGKYGVFEATASGSKCRYKEYTADELKSYGCYKFTGFSD